MLFDWLVIGQVMATNPATSVRGPKYSVKTGKTPVLTAEEGRALIDSIDITAPMGLRDRALIGLMVHPFARVVAALIVTRAERAGLIEHHRKEVGPLADDLAHLDATLKLFSPEIDLRTIRTKAHRVRRRCFRPAPTRLDEIFAGPPQAGSNPQGCA